MAGCRARLLFTRPVLNRHRLTSRDELPGTAILQMRALNLVSVSPLGDALPTA